MTELKFTVAASAGTPVTAVKVGSVSAPSVNGVAYLTGLALSVPNGGGGLNINATVSYGEVGTSGTVPGTTAAISLDYIKSTSGGVTTTLCTVAMGPCSATMTAVSAPTMIMVGSRPTVTAPTTQTTGLIVTGESQLGEITVAVDPRGNIKINDIVFTLGSSGFDTPPTSVSDPAIVVGDFAGSDSECSATLLVVTCEFGTTSNSDFDGVTLAAGTTTTFYLYGTLDGGTVTTGTPTISSSVAAATFNWDDTSSNGGAGSVNLDGTKILNFPSNSFSIRQ